MYGTNQLLRLADLYSNSRWVKLSTLGRLAAGNATFFKRLKQGRVTIRRADAVFEWFASNWPEGVEWPRDIPRPRPARTQKAA